MVEDKNVKNETGDKSWLDGDNVGEMMKRKEEELFKPEIEKKRRKKIWLCVILMIVLVALAVGISFLVLNLVNQSSSGNEGGEDGGATASSNTELSSGSVKATIGGKTVTYKAAYVVDGVEATISSGTYESNSDNETVFLVINGGALRIDGGVTISKTGSENFSGRGDNYSFYGTNSAIVVVGEGSSVSINGATISTDVSGANAVVATNKGEAVIYNSEIKTSKDNSRGLHATYEGSITTDNVSITTLGGSCATLAIDRGGGTVTANNMKLSTAGAGSPLVYSTGSITVSNSTGSSTGAQIAVVEGKNSIDLNGCEFSANGVGNRGSVDNAGVMIYQSMSGDASVGTGSFTATDSTLTVLSSSSVYDSTPFFFVTNTEATIDLTGTTISFSDKANFISALGTSEWGKSGSNGGKVTITTSDLTATNTKVEADSISSVSGL